MNWISVKDRLPDQWEPCWIFWRDREVVVGCRTYKPNEYDPCEGWYEYENKVRNAHWWMPLVKPEPPELPKDI